MIACGLCVLLGKWLHLDGICLKGTGQSRCFSYFLIVGTKYPAPKVKGGKDADSLWRFQTIISWLQGRVENSRGATTDDGERQQKQQARGRLASFCLLYCIPSVGMRAVPLQVTDPAYPQS